MKVSVITINYNNEKGLVKTIQSVVDQSFVDKEFLLIDGASTDGSDAIIQQHENCIDYWISEPDKGIYHAMNKGIKKAQGEYLIFMNSGDVFYESNTLKEAVRKFENKDIIYGDVYRKKTHKLSKRIFPDTLSFSFFYRSSLCHQSAFIKKALFDTHFLYNVDSKIAADWELFVYAICKENASYKHIDQLISVFDFSGISSNKSHSEIHKNEKMAFLDKHFPLFVEDYKTLDRLTSKRTQQFFYVQQFPIVWKLMKAFLNIILIFLPKKATQ